MTCGIYKLSFHGLDQVYIGQSINIEKRFREHLATIKSGLSSAKLIEAYEKYGNPNLEILYECSIEELDLEEEAAIEVWDSFANGLNSRDKSTGGGYGSYGDRNARSKYSNKEIEKVFFMLLDKYSTGYSNEYIAGLTGVSKWVVNSISNGYLHTWLGIKYPDKYNELINKKHTKSGSAEQRGKICPVLVDKNNNEFSNISNIREFARLHSLDSGGLNKLINGKLNSHRGWKRK